MTRPKPSRPKPIRRFSTKRAAMMRIYAREAPKFIADNPWCCWFLAQTPPQRVRATQLHHKFGRVGKLLLWKPGWKSASAEGHDKIHRHPEQARKLGLLAPLGQYNNQSLVTVWEKTQQLTTQLPSEGRRT